MSWERARAAIDVLRDSLGEDKDPLVPLTNGGVVLAKLGSVMHDTCNTANDVAHRIKVLRDDSGKLLHGVGAWNAMDADDKLWLDYLCGNHSRNLPIDAFNRRFEEYIKKILGSDIDAAKLKGGGCTRIEPSGIMLLRSICKLTHSGVKSYVKGDGLEFQNYLRDKFPETTNKCVGRAEFSNRQDWSVEASAAIYPLMQPLLFYVIYTLCRIIPLSSRKALIR